MVRTGFVLLLLALIAFPATAVAREPRLTMRQAHADVERDLDYHFRGVVGIEVWGCQRRSATAVRCYTEFHRHNPMAVCVAHYDLARRTRGVVLAFRGVDSLFGTHCRRAASGVRRHYHLLRHG